MKGMITIGVVVLVLSLLVWQGQRQAGQGVAIVGTTAVRPIGIGDAEFMRIAAGAFQMGSSDGRNDERPARTVRISRPFLLQRTEVTQAQWRSVMDTDPSAFKECGDDCPVDRVSWDDVQTFLGRLNAQALGKNYRLPTEAEWEYAARAGSTGDYGSSGALNDMGWYDGNARGKTHRVAQLKANAWGLYDMHGNVWEWVQDWYGPYSTTDVVDPTGSASGSSRVLRGGSWYNDAGGARSAFRFGYSPSGRGSVIGFRLARAP